MGNYRAAASVTLLMEVISLISAPVYDLADEDSILPAYHFAFQHQRVLVDDGGIHVSVRRMTSALFIVQIS
jgi:hypothetical protein